MGSLLRGTQAAESNGETDYDNASFFIDSVHSVASDVAKVISLKVYIYKKSGSHSTKYWHIQKNERWNSLFSYFNAY